MSLFLKVSALFEGVTGLSLMMAPSLITQVLFLSQIEDGVAIFIARIAGAALITIALLCWFARDSYVLLFRLLVFYNIAAVFIAIYSLLNFNLKGIGVEAIIFFHIIFAIWGILVLKKSINNS